MNEVFVSGVSMAELLSQIEIIVEKKISQALNYQTPAQSRSEYLTRKEVAKLLQVSLPTLHEWTKLGFLKSYKIGKRVYFKPKEIEEALHSPYLSKVRKQA